MELTFSKLIKGFAQWFNDNQKEITESFTPEAAELFDTLEDFAVEIYCEIKI
jgi:hypothetical protein